MTMTFSFDRLLKTAWLLALLLALPGAARAACFATVGDFDHNGTQDILLSGENTTNDNITVTVDATASTTTVNGCLNHTWNTIYGTYFLKPNGGSDNVTFNVAGDWVNLHVNVEVQLGIGVDKFTIGGSGILDTGSSLIVEMSSLSGRDTLTVNPPAMVGSFLDVRTFMGPGNDATVTNI